MNVLKITLSIVFPHSTACTYISYLLYYYYNLSFHLRPFLEDVREDLPVNIYRVSFDLKITLVISRSENVSRLFFLRLMHSESVVLSSFSFSYVSHPPLRVSMPSRSASRGVATSEVEKLSPRFHPNVTDLTSRGDAARFPRIIILLSYNSFNSRESKVGEESEEMPRVPLALASAIRRALTLRFK